MAPSIRRRRALRRQFPVDYICEGVDQTRGWFYTLLAVSTTVFDSPAYKRCLSLGLILDAEGEDVQVTRQHRRPLGPLQPRRGRRHALVHGDRRRALEPTEVRPKRRETYAKMFLTLWNVYKFHADYAALDGYDAEASSQWTSRTDPRWTAGSSPG